MTSKHGAPRSERASSPLARKVKPGTARRAGRRTPEHERRRAYMGRNVTIGLGTLIIIIILVALLF